jgi:hypothetical protein
MRRVVSDQTTTELVGLVLVEFRVCRCRVDRVLLWTLGEHEQVLRASLDRRGDCKSGLCTRPANSTPRFAAPALR